MSDAFYSAFVEIVPDASKLRKTLASEFDAAGPEAGRNAGKGINSGVLGAIGGLAAPIQAAFATIGIGKIIGDSISASSDLQQSIGGVDAVFGSSADAIHGWAQGAAAAAGLSENSYNELASVIGSQLKNSGLSMDLVAGKTNDLIGLGADLSATFGGTTADAVSALSSAFKGERDPIERYGVSLTQASIDAEATALGFTKVSGAWSAQANQAATLALVMAQTSSAQGQFALQSNTLAEQQQKLSAGVTDLSASFGNLFLPIVTTVVGFLAGSVVPGMQSVLGAINDVIGGFTNGTDAVGTSQTAFAAFGASLYLVFSNIRDALEPVFAAIGPLFSDLASALAPIAGQFLDLFLSSSPTMIVLQALLPILPQVADVLGQLAKVVGGALLQVFQALAPIIEQVAGVLSGVLSQAVTTILPVIANLVSMLGPILGSVITSILPIITLLAGLFSTLLSAIAPLIAPLLGLLTPILGLIAPLLQLVGAILTPLIQLLAALLVPIIGLIEPLIGLLVPVLQFLVTVLGYVITAVVAVIQWIADLVTGSGDAGDQLSAVWNNTMGMFADFFSNTIGMFSDFVGNTAGMIGDFVGSTVGMFSDFWNNTVGMFSDGIGNIVSFFTGLPGQIMSALGDMGSFLLDAGKDLIQGFIDGISNMVGAVGDAIGGVMDFVGGFFPHSPAERGPFSGSGWTAVKNAGIAIGNQFGSGLDASAPVLTSKLGSMLDSGGLTARLEPTVYGSSASNPGRVEKDKAPAVFHIHEATSAMATALQVNRIQNAETI